MTHVQQTHPAKKMIDFKINHQYLRVPEGITILEAAHKARVRIPTLCHLDLHDIKMVNQTASCRVCMVELIDEKTNRDKLVPACVTTITDGMEVLTHTLTAITARRMAVELLLSNHPNECFTCPKNGECELQALAAELGVRHIRWEGERMNYPKDVSSEAIVKDANKCIYCRRCETMCNKVQTCGILSGIGRGFEAFVGPAFNIPMVESSCTYCGQCVQVCPTAALTEINHTDKVWEALNNPDKYVIVQTAPAIRVAIGEIFDMEPGTIATGQLVTALKRIGFNAVFDTDFGADLTIMEEASELIYRLQNNKTLPILTSCCPAWVKFIEHQFPELLEVPSTCKSPHIMFGTIVKTYYAEKNGIDPDNIVVVSVMPCIAKKAEAKRPELTKDEHNNVDIVVTTRELGLMIKEAGLDFSNLPSSEYDKSLGETTGASVIFGTSGGVIEAALRTAYEWLTGEELQKVEFEQLRGDGGLRKATVQIGDKMLRIGIASGLGNARTLLEEIRDGKNQYEAIEIMACPGGCVAGGGQPYHHGNFEIVRKRQEAIYQEDKNKKIRKSHENSEIQKLYQEYLGQPFSDTAHRLLHTHFEERERI
ncbi:Periplasmic [Fe] hydrogenase large subunit [Dehalobacter sp. UNSWDHB]|jgi:hydrogenases, Fe-only|uniref:NADH-dependent [FeFe] hydrogenase, group A6 n=1 Tax=unclassified Dehalobacter TaxID=2635733 RepID=UPI00028AF77D|nr:MULTISPECIES: NADH-dependent [FeFe] hydrogenase, group A6 [unclassified Dehalobacter]AFV02615.1 putative iron-only hydrogenase, catalytic subunit HymC [Dehalobacter sp. DCA]AFV05601.1 putative iron-only hydrogenase, catalytic subunit HymC [Dehalobacter sp. CF]EQB21726.1 Periplasmic [Fe] hydrogenase large subunit [Dehalobacter sp. UNSWDHB]